MTSECATELHRSFEVEEVWRNALIVRLTSMTDAKAAPGPDLLDDLCTRFILNVPASELEYASVLSVIYAAHCDTEKLRRKCCTELI